MCMLEYGAGVQANGCGRSNIERFFTPWLRNAHQQGRVLHQGAVYALPFVPEYPGAWRWERGLVQQGGPLQMRNQQRDLQLPHVVQRAVFKQAQTKVRPHARTQYLGRAQGCRTLQGQYLLEAQGACAAQDGACVAGVLNAVEDDGMAVRIQIACGLQKR